MINVTRSRMISHNEKIKTDRYDNIEKNIIISVKLKIDLYTQEQRNKEEKPEEQLRKILIFENGFEKSVYESFCVVHTYCRVRIRTLIKCHEFFFNQIMF